jgi:hypothetical protein
MVRPIFLLIIRCKLQNIYRSINVKAGRSILPGIGTNSLGSKFRTGTNCLGNFVEKQNTEFTIKMGAFHRDKMKRFDKLLDNKGNNKISELRTILQRESKNSDLLLFVLGHSRLFYQTVDQHFRS